MVHFALFSSSNVIHPVASKLCPGHAHLNRLMAASVTHLTTHLRMFLLIIIRLDEAIRPDQALAA